LNQTCTPPSEGKKEILIFLQYRDRLVGDFNNWDVKKHRLRKASKGRWTKIVTLAPGGMIINF
jgi:hypothetical protein